VADDAAGDPAPVTVRGQQRREAILDAAAALFLERGFHGTSIDEVGAAAGISGPGVYRHVASKDALLMAVLDRLWSEGFGPAIRAVRGAPPRDALEILIATHVDLAIGQATALVVLVTELRHLPDDYRARALHNHRRYVDAWVGPIRELKRGASDEQARAVAAALHGLIDSAARAPTFEDDVDPTTRSPLLRELATGALDHFLGR
jgi:AcrR family transcriptional regulator